MKLMPIEDLKRLPVKVGAFFILCRFMYYSIIRKLISLPYSSPSSYHKLVIEKPEKHKHMARPVIHLMQHRPMDIFCQNYCTLFVLKKNIRYRVIKQLMTHKSSISLK